MVVLGFSGFGLAALPLGLLADAVTLEVTMVGDGRRRARRHGGFAAQAAPAPPTARRRRVRLRTGRAERSIGVRRSTRRRGSVATQCSAMRPSSMRWIISQVTIERSPVSRLMPLLVALVQTLSPSTTRSSIDVSARDNTRWNSRQPTLVGGATLALGPTAHVADERIGEQLVDRIEVAIAPDVVPPALADRQHALHRRPPASPRHEV